MIKAAFCNQLNWQFYLEISIFFKYSGLHKNWPFAYFEKITVAVGWVYIKVWPIPHLKALTPTFWPT
jgi:hypothetical protein